MGNGAVALIIDISGLVHCARRKEAQSVLQRVSGNEIRGETSEVCEISEV